MRIAWFSPATGTSGISEFTRAVLPELARHAEPELWTVGRPHSAVAARVVDLTVCPEAIDTLGGYDAAVYNMGNHLDYHRVIHQVSRLHPGIVLLHDRSLHHFFAGYFINYLRRPDLYRQRMRRLYGERGREVADGVLEGHEERAWSHDEEVVGHAWVEESLHGALGAIVHSHGHAESVRARWHGPLLELRLPAYSQQLAAAPHPPAPSAGRRVVLMSTGHVERTKRLDEVIAVLAADPQLAARVRYEIVGPFDARSGYVRELHGAIARAGLAETVSLLGYQPAASFERLAEAADIFINLRRPNLEGGSASLMGQLARERAVVVYDSGCFAEVPDDCVVKTSSADGLRAVLRELVHDADLRAQIGARGRRYAERCRLGPYVHELLGFCEQVGRTQPLLALADRAGTQLGWMAGGVPPAGSLERISASLQDLMPRGISGVGTS